LSYHKKGSSSSQLHTRYHPLLAGYDIHGKPWVNPEVSKRLGSAVADKILKHETVFLTQVSKPGVSWSEARQAALEAEHSGMNPEQIQSYEGRIAGLENALKRNPPLVDPIALDIEDEREAGPHYRAEADQLEREGKKEEAEKLRAIAKEEDHHKEILVEIDKSKK
jgi:hypothetical protein